MRNLLIIIVCAVFLLPVSSPGQESDGARAKRNLRIQNIMREVLGKTVALQMKEKEQRGGTLVSADAADFVLGHNDSLETIPTSEIRSVTIRAGFSEGILVAVSGVLLSGFGLGVAILSFNNVSTGVQTAVATLCGFFGAWLGYESFFQDTVIELPQ